MDYSNYGALPSDNSSEGPISFPPIDDWNLNVRESGIDFSDRKFFSQLFSKSRQKTLEEGGIIAQREMKLCIKNRNEFLKDVFPLGRNTILGKRIGGIFAGIYGTILNTLTDPLPSMQIDEAHKRKEIALAKRVASTVEKSFDTIKAEEFKETYKYLVDIEDKKSLLEWLNKFPEKDRIENLLKIVTYATNLLHYPFVAELFSTFYKESPSDFEKLAKGWLKENRDFPIAIWVLFDHLENCDFKASNQFCEFLFSEALTKEEQIELWETLSHDELLASSFLKRLEDSENVEKARYIKGFIKPQKTRLAQDLVDQFLPGRQATRILSSVGINPLRIMNKILSDLELSEALSDKTKSTLTYMQKRLIDAQNWSIKDKVLIQTAGSNKSNLKIYLENMAREAAKELTYLKEGEFLILPISCHPTSFDKEGHAVQLVIQRNKSDFSLFVYNSGIGVDTWHSQAPHTDRFQSFFELSGIPLENLTGILGEKNIENILSSTLGEGETETIINQFYESLLKVANKPKDYRPPPSTNPFHYKLSQSGMNCTTQCLFRLLNGMLISNSSESIKEQEQYKQLVSLIKQKVFRYIDLASKASSEKAEGSLSGESYLAAQMTYEKSKTILDLRELSLEKENYLKLYTLLKTFNEKEGFALTNQLIIEVPNTPEERFLKLKELSSELAKELTTIPGKPSALLAYLQQKAVEISKRDPEKLLLLDVVQKRVRYILALPIKLENRAAILEDSSPLTILNQITNEILTSHKISSTAIRETVARLISSADCQTTEFAIEGANILKELCKDSKNIFHIFEIIQAIKDPKVSKNLMQELLKSEWKYPPISSLHEFFQFKKDEEGSFNIHYLILPLSEIPTIDKEKIEKLFPFLPLINPLKGPNPAIDLVVDLIFNKIEAVEKDTEQDVIILYRYLNEFQNELFKKLVSAVGKHEKWTGPYKNVLLTTPYSWTLPLEAFPDCPMAVGKRVAGYLQDRRNKKSTFMESSDTWEATQFFSESLKNMDLSSGSLKDSTRQSINTLQKKMEKCAELSEKLFMVTNSKKQSTLIKSDQAIQIQKIGKELENEVKNLKVSDFLIIPVKSHDHSLRLVIKRQEDGRFQLHLYNSGAGIKLWHPRYFSIGNEGDNEERFQTFFELNDVPSDSFSTENFSKLFRVFLSESINDSYVTLIEDFAKRPVKNYKQIGPLSTPPPNPYDFKLPQIRRNCATQCMLRLLNDMILNDPNTTNSLTVEERYQQYKIVIGQLKKMIAERANFDSREIDGTNNEALERAKRSTQKSGVNLTLSNLAKDRTVFETAYAHFQTLAQKLELITDKTEDPLYFDNVGKRFLALKKINQLIANKLLTRNIIPEKFKECLCTILDLKEWNSAFDALEQRYANAFDAMATWDINAKKRYFNAQTEPPGGVLNKALWRDHLTNELLDMIGKGTITKTELIDQMGEWRILDIALYFKNFDEEDFSKFEKKIAEIYKDIEALPVLYKFVDILFKADLGTENLRRFFPNTLFGSKEKAQNAFSLLFDKIKEKEITKSQFDTLFAELDDADLEQIFSRFDPKRKIETLKLLTDPSRRETFLSFVETLPHSARVNFLKELAGFFKSGEISAGNIKLLIKDLIQRDFQFFGLTIILNLKDFLNPDLFSELKIDFVSLANYIKESFIDNLDVTNLRVIINSLKSNLSKDKYELLLVELKKIPMWEAISKDLDELSNMFLLLQTKNYKGLSAFIRPRVDVEDI